MRRLLLILALLVASPCFGQSTEPYLINAGRSSSNCPYTANVVSGNPLVAIWFWKTVSTTPSIPTDTVGTTFSLSTIDVSGTVKWAVWTGLAGGSGANTITFSNTGATSPAAACGEFNFGGISFTVDVATLDNFTSKTSRNTSVTTTQDGDFMLSACYVASADCNSTTDITYTAVHGTTLSAAFRVLGTLGSQTSSWVIGASDSGAVGIVTFKPTTMNIKSPSALPSASITHAYQYKVLEEGATASVTWSIIAGALPLGLTLNSSTGVISGTPTNSSAGFTIQATDGTHTASKAMTLNVGTSFATITHLQDSGTTGIFPGNAASGSLILVIKRFSPNSVGVDFVGCTDTLNTPYRLIATIPQQGAITISGLFSGVTTQAGADTVTCAGGGVGPVASEFSNAQNVWDYNDFNSSVATLVNQVSGTSLTTSSITPLSEDALIYAHWSIQNNVPFTITAPCNAIPGYIGCYQVSTTITAYTENTATSGASGLWSSLITGAFRPSISGTAPLPPSGYPVIY